MYGGHYTTSAAIIALLAIFTWATYKGFHNFEVLLAKISLCKSAIISTPEIFTAKFQKIERKQVWTIKRHYMLMFVIIGNRKIWRLTKYDKPFIILFSIYPDYLLSWTS